MKWIVVAIALFIAAYTFLTLNYRKSGPAYRPFQDSKEKATVQRLKSAGYRRITATAERPADAAGSAKSGLGAGAAAVVTDYVGGLPSELKETLIDQPRLAHTFSEVRASSSANRLFPYTVQFACGLPDNKRLLADAYVYVKDDEIAIVTDFELIEGELLSRTRESIVLVTIPAGTLHEGVYRVTLVGERGSKQWTLQVH